MPEYLALMQGKEAEIKEKWELSRWEQFMQIQSNGFIKQSSKPATPQALVRFPWEKDDTPTEAPKPLTEEEATQLNKIFQ